MCDAAAVAVRIDSALEGIDWAQAKADLAADSFDNGRSPAALERLVSAVAARRLRPRRGARRGHGPPALGRVCNAYLVDVWTMSAYRRQGIASAMVRLLVERVPGQHVGLQTDDAQELYSSLGFRPQPEFWSIVSGRWLDNDANR